MCRAAFGERHPCKGGMSWEAVAAQVSPMASWDGRFLADGAPARTLGGERLAGIS